MHISTNNIFGVILAVSALVLSGCGNNDSNPGISSPGGGSPSGGNLVLGDGQAWIRDSSTTGYIFRENGDFVVIWEDPADPELDWEGGWVGLVQGKWSVSGGTIYLAFNDYGGNPEPIGTYSVSGNTLDMTLLDVHGIYKKTDNITYTDIGGDIVEVTERDGRLTTGYGEAWVNDESGFVFEVSGAFYPIVWDVEDEIWNKAVNERGSWSTHEGQLTLVSDNEEYDPLTFVYTVSGDVLTAGIAGGAGTQTFTKRDDIFPRMVVGDWCWWCGE